MNESYSEIHRRLEEFATARGRAIHGTLGYGWDGLVVQTDHHTAMKGFRYEQLFQRERDVYLRLQQHDVTNIHGFSVPALIDYDDRLMVVEMGIVFPPFVLDFAGARLDSPPEFPADVLEEWEADKQEQFEDDWPEVRSLMAAFERLGIYLGDVHPGNIRFISKP